jgi:hypothetical protein
MFEGYLVMEFHFGATVLSGRFKRGIFTPGHRRLTRAHRRGLKSRADVALQSERFDSGESIGKIVQRSSAKSSAKFSAKS